MSNIFFANTLHEKTKSVFVKGIPIDWFIPANEQSYANYKSIEQPNKIDYE